jgi:acetyl esterase/lipase
VHFEQKRATIRREDLYGNISAITISDLHRWLILEEHQKVKPMTLLLRRVLIVAVAATVAVLCVSAFGIPAHAQQAASQGSTSSVESQIDRNVVFGMYGGLALLMDVYHPANPNGFGAIFIPGSGWRMPAGYGAHPLKNPAHGEFAYVRILVHAGYTVFIIDHRAAPIFHYPAQIEDAQRGVRFIRFHAKEYGIDPAHIAAVGASSGAHLASLLGLLDGAGTPADRDPVNQESARVQCVVAEGIPADLVPKQGKAYDPLDFTRMSDFIGETVSSPVDPSSPVYKKLEEASPVHYIKQGAPPFLLIHGDADETVPIAIAEEMRELLEKAGVPVKMVVVKGGAHGPTAWERSSEYSAAIVEWLNKYLRGNP